MKRKELFFIACAFLFSAPLTTYGQQLPLFSLYKYNHSIYNPAYAGSEEGSVFNVSYRRQWEGIKNAPITQAVTFSQSKPRSNIGYGLSILSSKVFIETQIQLYVDFSYKLNLTSRMALHLGLKAGGDQLRVLAGDLITSGSFNPDPLLFDKSIFFPNFGTGLLLKTERFKFSLSTPRLLKSTGIIEENGQISQITRRAHYFLFSSYKFYLNSAWDFTPSLHYAYSSAAPAQIIFDATFGLDNNLDLGLQYYINGGGLGGNFFFKVAENISVGYSATGNTNPDLLEFARLTHEFTLRIDLSKSLDFSIRRSTFKGAKDRNIGTKNKAR